MNEIDITMIGNVCSDVRHVKTDNGVPVASFRVASTPRRYRGNTWVDGVTTYASVTCWRAMADNVASSLQKGQPVVVYGRMTMRTWEADERSGQTVEIEAYAVGHDLRFGTSAFQRVSRKEQDISDVENLAAELAIALDRAEAVAGESSVDASESAPWDAPVADAEETEVAAEAAA